jgi:hypothetical protein
VEPQTQTAGRPTPELWKAVEGVFGLHAAYRTGVERYVLDLTRKGTQWALNSDLRARPAPSPASAATGRLPSVEVACDDDDEDDEP